MGEVALRFRVMPEKSDQSFEQLKIQIMQLGAREVKERPIAFGLKFLDVLFVVSDTQGTGDIEERLKKLHGVGSVETEGVTLI